MKKHILKQNYTNLLTTSESVCKPLGTAPIFSSTFGGSTAPSSTFACTFLPEITVDPDSTFQR